MPFNPDTTVAVWVPTTSPAKAPEKEKALRACRAGTRSVSGVMATPSMESLNLRPGVPRSVSGMTGIPVPPSSTA
jgi:hypothetical protein